MSNGDAEGATSARRRVQQDAWRVPVAMVGAPYGGPADMLELTSAPSPSGRFL